MLFSLVLFLFHHSLLGCVPVCTFVLTPLAVLAASLVVCLFLWPLQTEWSALLLSLLVFLCYLWSVVWDRNCSSRLCGLFRHFLPSPEYNKGQAQGQPVSKQF